MVSSSIALTTAIVYYIFSLTSACYMHAFTTRPITVAPVLGMILGDPALGLGLGASLELVFMGITNIGGSIPSDVFLAATIVTPVAIYGGYGVADLDSILLPLAVAIGLVAAMWSLMVRIVYMNMFVAWFEGAAAKGDDKKYNMLCWIATFTNPLFSTLLVYLAITLGAEGITNLMAAIPAFLQDGITLASKMMPAVGLALLMNMLWSWKMSVYYFFGFFVTLYLGVSMTFMVIIAAFITLIQVYNELDLRNRLKTVGGAGKEDDLFG